MADVSDAMDQIEHSALQQLVVLGMGSQSLRARLDGDGVTLEESVVLGQMLAGMSNLMLQWVDVLIGEDDGEEHCAHCDEVCGSGPEET